VRAVIPIRWLPGAAAGKAYASLKYCHALRCGKHHARLLVIRSHGLLVR